MAVPDTGIKLSKEKTNKQSLFRIGRHPDRHRDISKKNTFINKINEDNNLNKLVYYNYNHTSQNQEMPATLYNREKYMVPFYINYSSMTVTRLLSNHRGTE